MLFDDFRPGIGNEPSPLDLWWRWVGVLKAQVILDGVVKKPTNPISLLFVQARLPLPHAPRIAVAAAVAVLTGARIG